MSIVGTVVYIQFRYRNTMIGPCVLVLKVSVPTHEHMMKKYLKYFLQPENVIILHLKFQNSLGC